MEVKSRRIKLSKADKYVETEEAFGWEIASKEDMRPDNTILLTLQRDPSSFSNYSKIKSLEKQYHKIARPLPITTIVLAIIGLAFLVAYLFLKQDYFFAIAFLYGALTFFCIALYALVVFLIIFIKKGKLLMALKRQAATKSGSVRDWPTPRNVFPEEDNTWALMESLK